MVVFKKGEFISRDISGIVDVDNENKQETSIWDEILTESCWVFVIPTEISEIGLFNAMDNKLYIVPKKAEFFEKHYDNIWRSKLLNMTVMFKSLEQALNYLMNYNGLYKQEVEQFYHSVMTKRCNDKAVDKFKCLFGVGYSSNMKFYQDLGGLIESNGLNPSITFKTIKHYMLDWYKRTKIKDTGSIKQTQ